MRSYGSFTNYPGEVYEESRITADLQAAGIVVDPETGARSMRWQGLDELSTRSFQHPGHRKHTGCRHRDLCERIWGKTS